MGDYISREDAVDAIERTQWYHISDKGVLVRGANGHVDEPLYKAEDVYSALKSVSPADVRKNVHGEWIPYSVVYENRHRCSKCDYHLVGTPKEEAHFCPNCGSCNMEVVSHE